MYNYTYINYLISGKLPFAGTKPCVSSQKARTTIALPSLTTDKDPARTFPPLGNVGYRYITLYEYTQFL